MATHALTTLLAHAADYATFALAVTLLGVEGEMNQFIRLVYGVGGLALVGLVKMGLATVAVGIALAIKRPATQNLSFAIAIGVGLFGVGMNMIAMWRFA